MAACTILIDLACFILGVPILSLIYGLDLQSYKLEMLLLIISGFFYAASTVIMYALSTMRKQKLTTVSYIITAVLALIVSNLFVNKFGIMGAVWANMITTITLFTTLVTFLTISLRKTKNSNW